MIRFATALALAVLVHGAGLAVVAWFRFTGEPVSPATLPEIQLTSVELSFSEQQQTEGEVGASAPSADPAPPVPSELVPPEARLDAAPQSEPLAPDAPLSPEAPKAQEAIRLPAPAIPEAPSSVASAPAENVDSVKESQRDTAQVEVPPQPRAAFRPVYPRGCRQRREEGVVTLSIAVTAEGKVEHVKVVQSSGFPELDQAALAAAKRAGFSPAVREGRPVPGTVQVPIVFRLLK